MTLQQRMMNVTGRFGDGEVGMLRFALVYYGCLLAAVLTLRKFEFVDQSKLQS